MQRTAFRTGKAWLSLNQSLKIGSPSLRESFGLRRTRPTVIIIDGKTFDGNESAIAKNIIALSAAGQTPVIIFNSLPQVSKYFTLNPNESLPECVNNAEREMAKKLRQEVGKEEKSLEIKTVGTRILINHVSLDPNIYIGPALTLKELVQEYMGSLRKVNGTDLRKLERPDQQEWLIREFEINPETTGRFKRVVHTSNPVQFQAEDLKNIIRHSESGSVVICTGSLPIERTGGCESIAEKSVEALIDGNLASALLAAQLKARKFIVSTSLEGNFPWLKEKTGYLLAKQMLHLHKKQQFKENTTAAAVINALRRGVNTSLITSPELDWANEEGILLSRGADLSGRIYNFARMVGLVPNELQVF